MPKQLRYVIRVRQHGEPWRQLWAGEGEETVLAFYALVAAYMPDTEAPHV